MQETFSRAFPKREDIYRLVQDGALTRRTGNRGSRSRASGISIIKLESSEMNDVGIRCREESHAEKPHQGVSTLASASRFVPGPRLLANHGCQFASGSSTDPAKVVRKKRGNQMVRARIAERTASAAHLTSFLRSVRLLLHLLRAHLRHDHARGTISCQAIESQTDHRLFRHGCCGSPGVSRAEMWPAERRRGGDLVKGWSGGGADLARIKGVRISGARQGTGDHLNCFWSKFAFPPPRAQVGQQRTILESVSGAELIPHSKQQHPSAYYKALLRVRVPESPSFLTAPARYAGACCTWHVTVDAQSSALIALRALSASTGSPSPLVCLYSPEYTPLLFRSVGRCARSA